MSKFESTNIRSASDKFNKFCSRYLGSLIAGTLAVLSYCLGHFSWLYTTSSNNDFVSNLFLNLGSGILCMALTVGLIDFLLTKRSENDHKEAVTPRIFEMIASLKRISIIHSSLNNPSKDDLCRYQRSLFEVIYIAKDLYILISTKKQSLAAELAGYTANVRFQVEHLEDLIIDIQNAAIEDSLKLQVGNIINSAKEMDQLGNHLESRLVTEYNIPTSTQYEPISS
jgi:hypothetical protein